jgi:hypothetical protein
MEASTAMSQWYFWYWNWAILERLFPAICSFWLDGRSKHRSQAFASGSVSSNSMSTPIRHWFGPLRAGGKRQCGHHASKRDNKFSPSNMDCYVEGRAIQWRDDSTPKSRGLGLLGADALKHIEAEGRICR